MDGWFVCCFLSFVWYWAVRGELNCEKMDEVGKEGEERENERGREREL